MSSLKRLCKPDEKPVPSDVPGELWDHMGVDELCRLMNSLDPRLQEAIRRKGCPRQAIPKTWKEAMSYKRACDGSTLNPVLMNLCRDGNTTIYVVIDKEKDGEADRLFNAYVLEESKRKEKSIDEIKTVCY